MKQLKLKIMMSFTGILLGVVMLISASYAWFTVSVTPEIKRLVIKVKPSGEEVPFELSIDYAGNPEEANWTTELHLDELVENYSLKPVSTVDGKHWYLPTYSADGNVNGFWQLPNESEADMNIWANRADSDENYLIYVDVWVRTKSRNPQEMLLSNPLSVTENEQYYANYVLWDPLWTQDGEVIANDAMASLRIGFQYTPLKEDNITEGSPGPLYIYEPNADMRSMDFSEYLKKAEYEIMAEQTYTLTLDSQEKEVPVKVNEYEDKYVVPSQDPNESYEKKYYSTWAPQYDKTSGWKLVNVSDKLGNRLIVQKTSSWDKTELSQIYEQGGKITSDAIGNIGGFCKVNTSTGQLTTVDTSSRDAMTTVEDETIQKMRIFIWIEGQDVDCWNQIINGNIYANLEFMGRTK